MFVLTEGLLIYLDDEVVSAIARDLHRQPEIKWWVMDLSAPAIREMFQKGMGSLLDNAPMKFAPPDGVAFFEKLGWKARDILEFVREAARLRRLPLFLRIVALFLPKADPARPGQRPLVGGGAVRARLTHEQPGVSHRPARTRRCWCTSSTSAGPSWAAG